MPNRGFSGLAFVDQNLSRLKNIQIEAEEGYRSNKEHIHILYFGDFAPSGNSMDQHIKHLLVWSQEKYHLDNNITFERIALTPEQVDEYNLPPNPDLGDPNSEASRHPHNDPSWKAFIEKYGDLKQYEVDALHGFVPDDFKGTVLQAVDKYFDEDIYDDMLEEEHSFESLNKCYVKK